jgi:pimeloyl-ACP methyl ester carboxylesterase
MGDTVVLLHGLGRTRASMWLVAHEARRRGMDVLNWGYPSRARSIAEHAAALREQAGPRIERAERVHFVTHSLGGIVVRRFLADAPLPNMGRALMLAPPNAGSEVADRLRAWWLYRFVTGRPGQELGTGEGATPCALPAPDFELGVIAGSLSSTWPVVSRWVPAPCDGLVSVASAGACPGSSLLVVPTGHTLLPWTPSVVRRALDFLETGRLV